MRFSPFKILPVVEERYKSGHKNDSCRIMVPEFMLWNTNFPKYGPVT